MNQKKDSIRIPFLTATGLLLIIVLLEFLSIIHLNNGLFVYTLDDPYIHLSLARHIMEGHYGINNIEYSAPSSTILWPFILAPFADYLIFPFFLNILTSVATIFIFTKILQLSFEFKDRDIKNIFVTVLLILLIFATNMVGLIFNGMEHSFQVLTVSLIVYGLIINVKKNIIHFWLLIAIVAAPLIRYENLAISLAAVIYLFLNGYTRKGLSASLLILVTVGGFSLFLTSLNLYPLPTSILIKSNFVNSGGSFQSLFNNIVESMNNRQGNFIEVGLALLLVYMLIAQNPRIRKLAFISMLAVIIHLLVGRYGWFHRYEIYILTFLLLIIIYLFSEIITRFIEMKDSNKRLIEVLFSISFILIITGLVYIKALFEIPLASNNIYEQQYQMHRFAVEYYNKPVAVNDLGYVSYKNKNYILDLSGLASLESLTDKESDSNKDWMKDLTDKKKIGLVMIYKEWFHYIPEKWIKIGNLYLGKRQVTSAQNKVDFYATNIDAYYEIKGKLRPFINTLPVDVKFIFEE